ncbi:unnamed protein product, partial [Brassica oleracea var. botrytis]
TKLCRRILSSPPSSLSSSPSSSQSSSPLRLRHRLSTSFTWPPLHLIVLQFCILASLNLQGIIIT